MVRPSIASPRRLAPLCLLLLAAPVAGQGGLATRVDSLLDAPPFHRAHWGVLVSDEAGRERYAHDADRFFTPVSITKLAVAATAVAMLPAEYRATTQVYAAGAVEEGVLVGDLVVYGGGDPTFSARCYGVDTLAPGACDSLWTRMDALAEAIVHAGVLHVTGALIADGSAFEEQLVHGDWEAYDLNWWYAAPVSALGFNDNVVDITWGPGPALHAPPTVVFEPDVGLLRFENRARTGRPGERRTIDFFRTPGTLDVWAEGVVPLRHRPRTEYFAMPDPNRYFAVALRDALTRRGVGIGGPTIATTDSLRTRAVRQGPPLVSFPSRPLADMVFPVLNSSQNWFAEMLLKGLGRELAGSGSWDAGLEVERRFLVDSVGIDSTAFAFRDGSGLSRRNVMTPRTVVELLRYMRAHPRRAPFLAALPRAGQPGTIERRFRGSPLEGRVVAKTGTASGVNALAGYLERPDGSVWTFAIIVNDHDGSNGAALDRIDAVLQEIAR